MPNSMGYRRRMHRPSHSAARAGASLETAGVGATLRLTEVGLGRASRLRLAELGLRPGALLTVLARTAGGGRLVGIGTTRLALDRATVRHLRGDAVEGTA